MSKQLPLGSLQHDVQARLETLLQKEPGVLTPGEFNFLRGRRDYLSAQQRKYYDLEQPSKTADQGGDEEKEDVVVKFNRKEAVARLTELGVDFKKNAKNAVLEALLKEAEAKATEDENEEEDEEEEEEEEETKE